jgi:threonine aldolase
VDWSFASDNSAGAHPRVLEAIGRANAGTAHAYGDDPATERACGLVRELLGPDCVVRLVATGTAANVLGLAHALCPWDAVVCADVAHLVNDESTAPTAYGLTLIAVPTDDGRLRPADVERAAAVIGDEHSPQPRAVSITQTTELGLVYTAAEVRALADAAHACGMLLHVDGARLANAVASLDVDVADLTTGAGADIVSFGFTKNGALQAEAIVFADPALGERLAYTAKRGMQLVSKGRLLGAQVEALLADGLWLEAARHANAMARRLADGLGALDGVEVALPVQGNHVFVRLAPEVHARLAADYAFHAWQTRPDLYRLMCSWATEPDQVDALVARAAGV